MVQIVPKGDETLFDHRERSKFEKHFSPSKGHDLWTCKNFKKSKIRNFHPSPTTNHPSSFIHISPTTHHQPSIAHQLPANIHQTTPANHQTSSIFQHPPNHTRHPSNIINLLSSVIHHPPNNNRHSSKIINLPSSVINHTTHNTHPPSKLIHHPSKLIHHPPYNTDHPRNSINLSSFIHPSAINNNESCLAMLLLPDFSVANFFFRFKKAI